jgi:hypothetical protein
VRKGYAVPSLPYHKSNQPTWTRVFDSWRPKSSAAAPLRQASIH